MFGSSPRHFEPGSGPVGDELLRDNLPASSKYGRSSKEANVGVKFLSEEWAKAVTEALNSNDQFKQAAGSHSAKIQNVVSTPDGESKYYFRLQDGAAEVALGEIDDPEAVISQDYDTAVALMKNELSATAAYMSGRIRINGDLMRLMQLQGVIGTLPQAIKDIDVEY
jgi:putative sterol carrier protein